MKLLNLPLILVCTSLILGVLLGLYFPLPQESLLFVSFVATVILGVAYFYTKRLFTQPYTFISIAFICFLALGMTISRAHIFQNHSTDSSLFHEQSTLQLRIIKSLKPNAYNHNYTAEVIPGNRKSKPFEILLTEFHGDSLTPHLHTGDRVFIKKRISLVNEPKIPHQFNYRNYLKHQHVYGKIIFNRDEMVIIHSQEFSWRQISRDLKEKIRANLYASGFKLNQVAFIESLVLGKKDLLSKNIYNDFSKAGVLHILAVSGLHVGFILLILQFLFKPLSYNKTGRIVSSICIVVILWGYAFIVGFTPSITRAVTMFSFIAFAHTFKRESSSLNMLFLSAVALLIYDPCYIYHIGFQLSYAAVFSIITLYPILNRQLYFKYWLPRKIWGICCVTLTAQLGVFPLSLFYFHQIPGLFLLSNLLLIPFIFLVLTACIFCISWSFIAPIPEFARVVFEYIIEAVLNFVHFIASQNQFIIERVYFSQSMLYFSLISLLLLVFYVYQRKWRYLWLLSLSLLIVEGLYISEIYSLRKQERFYIFYQNKKNILGLQTNKQFTFITTDSLLLKPFEGLLIQDNLKQVNFKTTIKNYYNVFHKSIFIIDSTAVYNIEELNSVDYLVLMNSPQVNLERVVDKLKPKYIIADGSNYYSYLKRWEKTAIKKKIPFHHTGKKGTFVIDN